MPKAIHCRPEAFELFRSQMPLIETSRGLLTAAVAVSMHQLDDVCPEYVDGVIDQYAAVVRENVRSNSPRALLAHLHDVLFDQSGFAGNVKDFYNPLNSYVPAVLQSRRGLPITLTLIYKVIADRLGLVVKGVNAPARFLAAVEAGEDGQMLVDPFSGGQALSREEVFRRIEEAAGRTVPRVDEMLPTATHRQWIARLLQNLLAVFERADRMDDFRAMIELRGVLMTEG